MKPRQTVQGLPLLRVLDALPRAIIVTDTSGSIVLWNAMAESLYGWAQQEVLGRSVLEVLGPLGNGDDGPRLLQDALEGTTRRADRTVMRRDGTPVRILTATQPVLDDEGRVAFVVGVSEDVTELRGLEQQAQDLTDHLSLALDAGGLGTWHWVMASGRTDWDPRMEELFGLAPGTFDGTFEAWAALLHPDDRDRVLGIVQDAVAAKGSYRLEHRLVTPDGQVRWIEGAGRVTVSADGEVTGTIGCCQDVSDRIEAQLQRERMTEDALGAVERERVQRERLELIAAVNEALEGSDDLAEVMQLVTRAVVPRLGDWCRLFVLSTPESRVPLIETAHTDPKMVSYAQELQERFPYDPDSPTGMANVIRTGRAEFYPDITEALLESIDALPELQALVRQLALRSAIVVPLRKRGRIFGGMQFVMSDAQRRYTDEDVALVGAVAGRIAASLDNRRLRELRKRASEVDARMAEVARLLSGARDLESVMAIISSHVAQVIGSDAADAGVLYDAEYLYMSDKTAPFDPTHHRRFRRLPLAAYLPVTEAVRTGQTVLVEDLPAYLADQPEQPVAGAHGVIRGAAASPLFDAAEQPVGVLAFAWSTPHHFDDIDRRAIETLSSLCGQTMRRTQLSERAEDLARLAASLAAARTTRDVAQLLRNHGQERLGGAVVSLRILDPAASALRAIVPLHPPTAITQPYETVSLDAPSPVAEAAGSGQPVWIADGNDYASRHPQEADAARNAGLSAAVSVPFHTSDGAANGVITFAWPTGMRLDDLLRSTLTTITDLAAQTFERAALTETHQLRDAHLGRLSRALATASTGAGIGAAVAEHGPPLLGASFAITSAPDATGAALESPTLQGVPAALAERLDHLPLTSSTPTTEVFRRGEALAYPDLHSLEVDHPETARDARAGDLVALAALPLRDADGVTRGVLTVGWKDPWAAQQAVDGPASTAAGLIGQTLERTHLYETEHSVITSLQRRLLAPLPRVAGLDLAAYYEPAAGAIGMGGDWYEALELEDGSLVAVVGDVVGHGVEAIAAMAQVQHLVDGLLRTGTPLDQVLTIANDMIIGPDPIFATAQLLHVDQANQRLGYLNAAHPWALLRHPDGTVDQLAKRQHSMLGATMSAEKLKYVDMPVGALLLAYTDGLIERRGEVITDSIDRLAGCLARADVDGPLEEVLERIVHAARTTGDAEAATNDDIAALLVRNTGRTG